MRRPCALGLLACLSLFAVEASVESDRILKLPGLPGNMSSAVYSGYLDASAGGQHFRSHYIFTESQRNPRDDPLLLWQQGGPGSSGLGFGYLAELGPYRLTADSLSENKTVVPRVVTNPHSFDRVTNLLIFEHPPGTGFSYCYDPASPNKPIPCEWNDQSQAEAFAATMDAWYKAFEEYQQHELFFMGESYAGLLLPFFVDHLIQKEPTSTAAKQLRAVAIGNGCPGTSGSSPDRRGTCNGPYGSYDTQHIFESAYGHGGVSRALHDEIVSACNFPCKSTTWSEDCHTFSPTCSHALTKFHSSLGEFNIYNFMDNCGSGNQAHLKGALEYRQDLDFDSEGRHTGGETYPCGTGLAANVWLNDPEVRKALHMKPASFYGRAWSSQAGSGMKYTTYTGASYDLYPRILKHYRTTIYNGDADMCVPYNSNEDWIAALAAQEGYVTTAPWHPWSLDGVPAGYVTTYKVTGGPADFTFITIKGAGHMVPQYEPERAFAFLESWLSGQGYGLLTLPRDVIAQFEI